MKLPSVIIVYMSWHHDEFTLLLWEIRSLNPSLHCLPFIFPFFSPIGPPGNRIVLICADVHSSFRNILWYHVQGLHMYISTCIITNFLIASHYPLKLRIPFILLARLSVECNLYTSHILKYINCYIVTINSMVEDVIEIWAVIASNSCTITE